MERCLVLNLYKIDLNIQILRSFQILVKIIITHFFHLELDW